MITLVFGAPPVHPVSAQVETYPGSSLSAGDARTLALIVGVALSFVAWALMRRALRPIKQVVVPIAAGAVAMAAAGIAALLILVAIVLSH